MRFCGPVKERFPAIMSSEIGAALKNLRTLQGFLTLRMDPLFGGAFGPKISQKPPSFSLFSPFSGGLEDSVLLCADMRSLPHKRTKNMTHSTLTRGGHGENRLKKHAHVHTRRETKSSSFGGHGF